MNVTTQLNDDASSPRESSPLKSQNGIPDGEIMDVYSRRVVDVVVSVSPSALDEKKDVQVPSRKAPAPG